jgi:hypothetical protein
MAEILIKLKDNKMPTIQEWRTWMNNSGLPAANAFLAANYRSGDDAMGHVLMIPNRSIIQIDKLK